MGKSKDLATGNSAAYVETAGDTMTGNLGIGASPSVPLDVVKAGGGNFVARFQNTTDATPYGVHIKDASSGANGYPLFQVTNGAGSVAHLKVMSGTGHVLMPSQPSFFARGSQNNWVSISNGTRSSPTYATPAFNPGSHFSTSNGRFTAPVNGVYYFHFHPYVKMNSVSDLGYYGTTEILVNDNLYNGQETIYGYQNNGDYDQIQTVTSIMSLSSGDYVTTAVQANSADVSFYGSACYFMGYLIG